MSSIINNSLSTNDLQQMIEWGLKIYPCLIERKADGSKLPALFPRNGEFTKEWKWWTNEPQLSAQELSNYLNNGYTLAAVLPDNMAVIDCDDPNGYFSATNYLLKNNSQLVAEQSLSFDPANMKHHFYFRITKKISYCTKFADIGLQGSGEILGAGHLVFINPKGWLVSPSAIGNLPYLPQELQNKCMSKVKNHTLSTSNDDYTIKTGERNVRMVSFAGALRRKGASEDSIYKCLQVLNKQCEVPLEDSELFGIAASVGKYSIQPQVDLQAVVKSVIGGTPL